VFLYRAWGFSYYEFDIGYRVIGNRGEKFFSTGFKPDAIDIYAEQQITSINKEIQTPSNSGCANAGGWSNGFYEADDNRQWSITIGRTSASQNTHRYGASTHFGLRNLYRGGSGNRVSCGNFTGKVTSTNKTGFNMSFDFNSKFENNYGKEMVYFRAFDFKIAPPQVKTLRFENLSTEHAFKVIANISEGSNDISDCDITANSSKGNFMVYDGSVDKINSSWSRCTYNSVSYDDVLEWENRHDDSGELIKLNVTVNASDVDGQWSEKTETAKFHNNPPTVKKLEVTNYSYSHRFNFTSKVFADAYTPEELVGCKIKADDLDGNVYTFDGTIDHSVGGAQVAECEYDNINSSDIPGFEPEEKINVTVNLTDRRDVSGWNFSLHEIPNNPPTAYSEEPEDGGIGLGEPLKLNITVSDPDSDFLNVWFLNATDSTVIDYETSPSGQQVTGELPGILVGEEYEWYVKVGDGATNFTSPVFSFTKAVSRSFQVQLAIQHRYSDVIMSPDSTRQVFLEVRNQVPGKKTLTTMLKGDVEAAFADGSESKNYEIKGKSMRRFSITISPGSTGEHTLKVVTRNEDIGVNTSTSIPVRVKDFTTTTRVELPGIQLLQLVMLSLAGAATYYLRL
ncbi:MAG: hypothetical protein ABEJ98_05670, partial [Candidatus Nanohaloarchaea archaeon]